MIIGRSHRYVFVEVPKTASTAIAADLMMYYGGERILHKHATLGEFLKTPEGRSGRYFVFATVRHPLDAALSEYFKMRTNHRGRFTSERMRKTPSVTPRHVKLFDFVQSGGDFPSFFARFHTGVFNNAYLLLHDHMDYVMRYEQLQRDFSGVLQRLGVEQVRPIQWINRTQEKTFDFWDVYPENIRAQAMRLYWPYMRRWGYRFPPEWGQPALDPVAELRFISTRWLGNVVSSTMGIGPNSPTTWTIGLRDALRRVWS